MSVTKPRLYFSTKLMMLGIGLYLPSSNSLSVAQHRMQARANYPASLGFDRLSKHSRREALGQPMARYLR